MWLTQVQVLFPLMQNHLGDMVRWGGSGLILPENKIGQKKLKKK